MLRRQRFVFPEEVTSHHPECLPDRVNTAKAARLHTETVEAQLAATDVVTASVSPVGFDDLELDVDFDSQGTIMVLTTSATGGKRFEKLHEQTSSCSSASVAKKPRTSEKHTPPPRQHVYLESAAAERARLAIACTAAGSTRTRAILSMIVAKRKNHIPDEVCDSRPEWCARWLPSGHQLATQHRER